MDSKTKTLLISLLVTFTAGIIIADIFLFSMFKNQLGSENSIKNNVSEIFPNDPSENANYLDIVNYKSNEPDYVCWGNPPRFIPNFSDITEEYWIFGPHFLSVGKNWTGCRTEIMRSSNIMMGMLIPGIINNISSLTDSYPYTNSYATLFDTDYGTWINEVRIIDIPSDINYSNVLNYLGEKESVEYHDIGFIKTKKKPQSFNHYWDEKGNVLLALITDCPLSCCQIENYSYQLIAFMIEEIAHTGERKLIRITGPIDNRECMPEGDIKIQKELFLQKYLPIFENIIKEITIYFPAGE